MTLMFCHNLNDFGVLSCEMDLSKVNGRHLGGGAVAAKITANVWEIVQLSNLVTPLLYNGV